MRVLAIDPGTNLCGYALVARSDGPRRIEALEAAGALEMHGLRLGAICEKVDHLAGELGATQIVVERPGSWMNIARAKGVNRNLESLTKLYELIGALLGSMHAYGRPCRTVTDSEVKEAIAGRKSAKKPEVHRVLMAMGLALPQLKRQTCAPCRGEGLPDAHSPDAADAIAIGIYAARVAGA